MSDLSHSARRAERVSAAAAECVRADCRLRYPAHLQWIHSCIGAYETDSCLLAAAPERRPTKEEGLLLFCYRPETTIGARDRSALSFSRHTTSFLKPREGDYPLAFSIAPARTWVLGVMLMLFAAVAATRPYSPLCTGCSKPGCKWVGGWSSGVPIHCPDRSGLVWPPQSQSYT